jgi:acetyltransferase-like isoleucine patch superfamily enzyme
VHIATGAKVIQSITIGERTLVGAGATVTKNLASNKTLYVAKPFLR